MCVVCDTLGCCDSREQHTHDESCVLNPMNKIRRELEGALEAVKALQRNRYDDAAKRYLRNRITENGYLVIGNQTLVAGMMEMVDD